MGRIGKQKRLLIEQANKRLLGENVLDVDKVLKDMKFKFGYGDLSPMWMEEFEEHMGTDLINQLDTNEYTDLFADWMRSKAMGYDYEDNISLNEGLFSRKKEIKSFQDYNDYINGIDTTVTVYQKGDKFLVTRRGHEEYVIKTFDNVEDALRFASDMTNEEKFRTEPEHFTYEDLPYDDTDNDGIPNKLDLDSDGDGDLDT